MERSLGLVGAPNARDLGGLVTADGWRVRPGILLRAPALGRLADRDVAVLAGLGPAYVVDLRDASEIADAPPDRLPAAPAPVVRHLPLFDPRHPVFTYLSAVLQGHHGEGYQGLREQGTPTAMCAVYRWLVADPRAEARPKAPRWDPECRELRCGADLVKRFREPALNQETILAAFEEAGWSNSGWAGSPARRRRAHGGPTDPRCARRSSSGCMPNAAGSTALGPANITSPTTGTCAPASGSPARRSTCCASCCCTAGDVLPDSRA